MGNPLMSAVQKSKPSSRDQFINDHDYGDDQDDMNDSADVRKCHETNQPSNDQNYYDYPNIVPHNISSFSYSYSRYDIF